MNASKSLLSTAIAAALLGGASAQATVIDFESFTGPSTYAAAGARRDLSILTADGTVTISGGTILAHETFLPANPTTLYGTAFFGSTIPSSNPYLGTVTILFPTAVNSFYLDVYNGQVFNVTYTMTDNAGHSAAFLLAPNLASGTTQIGFSPSGNQVTISSDAGSQWDFSLDNIVFNDPLGLPPTVPTVPSTTPVPVQDPPPVTMVPTPTPQELQLAEQRVDQRRHDGLAEQGDRQQRKGRHGEKLDFRLDAQGFDDRLVPVPVPLPASLPLLAAAIAGLGWRRRRAG